MHTFARYRTKAHSVSVPAPVLACQPDGRVARQRRDIRNLLGRPQLQTRLKVSEPCDPLEQEADRTAERVMSAGPADVIHQAGEASPSVHRMCTDCAEEVTTRAALADTVHRQLEPAEEEEEQVQAKRVDGADVCRLASEGRAEEEERVQAKNRDGEQGHGAADAAVASGIGAGRPLPAGLRSFFERRFGHGFGNIRIHTDGPANAAAAALNADAFTHGRDVAFAKGAYQPDTGAGRRLIAHELAHTIQQGQNDQGENSRAVQRKVVTSKVDCRSPSKKQQKTVGKDPVGTIASADARAIKMIDLVISVLEGGRQRIIGGAPIAWPTLSDAVAVGLKKRFGLDYNDKAVWTGTGAGTVFKIIARYKAVKTLLESGKLHYICLAPKKIKRSYYSGEGCAGEWAFAFDGENEMFLCKPWWQASADNKATTLMHEAIHVVYAGVGDDGAKLKNAHCYEQYLADINGVSVPKAFKGSCS